MTAPTIDSTSSILGYKANEVFNFQPGVYAGGEGNDTVWSATGLPTGLTFNATATTGHPLGMLECAGIATPGTYNVTVRGVNNVGSCSQAFTIGIEADVSAASFSEDAGIDLDIDVVTREVSLAGATAAAAGAATDANPLFLLKEDDSVILNIRFKKGDLAIAPTLAGLRIGFKELETEALLLASGGSTEAGMSGLTASVFAAVHPGVATNYFQLLVTTTSTALAAALANYEADSGTEFAALCEIEWKQTLTAAGEPVTLVTSTKTFPVTIARDLVV